VTVEVAAISDLYPPAYSRAGLLDWLDDPATDRGIRFADDDGSGWTLWEYSRLAALAAGAAEQIVERRNRPEGPVTIVTRTGPEFVSAFVGSLIAGNTPSPLALPMFARDRKAYVDHAASILEAAQPALVVADEGVLELMREAAERAGLDHEPCALTPAESGVVGAPEQRAELALLQFTSGSSGRPRGVRVAWSNLEANVAMIRSWLRMQPDDHTAAWLPMYHDMGLIGAFLTPMVNQSDGWIMRPDQFIADPVRWLDCFGRHGVQLTVAPNFGFAYLAKRLDAQVLDGMDFDAWRVAIVGAERLDPAVLGGFAARLAPYGFRPETFLPAYGLAEATLAVTGVPLEEVPRAVRPDWTRAHFGRAVEVMEETSLDDGERVGRGDGWLVGCGRPHPGVSVAILDEEAAELADGRLGEIAVSGATVADGYQVDTGGGSTRFAGGRVLTGDAGFKIDGELFVVGRLGDSIKVRGRTVFVEDVEARLVGVDGVQKGKCVVLAGSDASRNLVVAVVEASAGDWVAEVAAILRSAVGGDAIVKVIAGDRGAIERTSSGKPRRRVMWKALVDGALSGDVVFDSSVPDGAG
jgi:acyl-CoA synthetase (AMP-forming)/AMP-acid ligase II